MNDREERIRARAYEIWENEGRPEGRSAEHWRMAAEDYASAGAEAPAKPAPRAATPRSKKAAAKDTAKESSAAPAIASDKDAAKPKRPRKSAAKNRAPS